MDVDVFKDSGLCYGLVVLVAVPALADKLINRSIYHSFHLKLD
jgi:hypothetical protein